MTRRALDISRGNPAWGLATALAILAVMWPGVARAGGNTGMAGAPAQQGPALQAGAKDVEVRPEPESVFVGRVLDVNGKPVPGADVTMIHGAAASQTDAEGRFVLAPSEWTHMTDGRTTIKAFFAEVSLPGNQAVRAIFGKMVQSGADLKGDVVLRRVGVVRGRVVDDQGNPLSNARVQTTVCCGRASRACDSCQTDKEGRYAFRRAPAGIELYVMAQGERHGQNSLPHCTLKDGETVEMKDLVLPSAPKSVQGIAEDEDGLPLAGIEVGLSGNATGVRHAKTDDQGRFRFDYVVDEPVAVYASLSTDESQFNGRARTRGGDTDVQIVLRNITRIRLGALQQAGQKTLVGSDAPALDVAAWVSGNAVDLTALRGKSAVVLAFLDTADSATADVMSCLKALPAQGLTIIVIHRAGADLPAVRERLARNPVPFPVAIDKPGESPTDAARPQDLGVTFKKYGVRRPPGVFLINKEGKVQFQDLPIAAVPKCIEALSAGK